MATPKISTQASTPTFPTGAAQCDRLLRVNDIREITGWSENTARKFMRESGKLIQVHRSNYMFESSFYELFKPLIINFIRTLPTFIRTCADECGNPIP